MHTSIRPFQVSVDEERIDDLKQRLRNVRLPVDNANDGWKYGTSRHYLESFIEAWLDYDWRETEAAINSYDNYVTEIDGVKIHFLLKLGRGPDPKPLLLTHGWPWTFWDYREAVDILTDPESHGGRADQSFDVVVPSLPGFGFSTPMNDETVGTSATADIWAKLMERLGYEKYGAAGGDFGVTITAMLGHRYSERLLGVHTTTPPILGTSREGQSGESSLDTILRRLGGPASSIPREAFAPDERHRWDVMKGRWIDTLSHVASHTTGPQTLAYGMHDSPVALASWILERRHHYSSTREIEAAFSRQFLLELVSIYWFTDSFVSSARYYWPSMRTPFVRSHDRKLLIEAPVGVALFPQELIFTPRKMVEQNVNLVHWTEQPRGGHFAASEVPDLWANDVRDFVATVEGLCAQ